MHTAPRRSLSRHKKTTIGYDYVPTAIDTTPNATPADPAGGVFGRARGDVHARPNLGLDRIVAENGCK